MTEGQNAMPKSTSSNKPLDPHERYVKFLCFNCGEMTIWRGQKDRKFVRDWVCPKCGFTGP